MSSISDDKLKSTLEKYFATGETHLSSESLNRYKRRARKTMPEWYGGIQKQGVEIEADSADIGKMIQKSGVSVEELKRILTYTKDKSPVKRQVFKDYFTSKTTIGVFSDSHIGHEMFDEPLFRHMVRKFDEHKVEKVYSVGDNIEGMSGRDGQIFELSEIGFSRQIEKAEEMYSLIDKEIYGIDGNHDEWHCKKNNAGVIVGEELEKRLDNYTNLGHEMATVEIAPNITMMLFHANDGTAYAISYKMQKLMESFTGGEKPNILLSGHYHKAMYMFNRNIHGVECGTLCGQTGWMRGKKIPAHKGFWIIDVELGSAGVGMFAPRFFPGYK